MSNGSALSWTGGNLKLAFSPGLSFVVAVSMGANFSCVKKSAPDQAMAVTQMVTWGGRPPVSGLDSLPADTTDAGAAIRYHHLVFAGPEGAAVNLRLQEFRTDYWAFAAWRKRGVGYSAQRGAVRIQGKWHFAQGRYVGEADTAGIGFSVSVLRDNLLFAGEPEFPIPAPFASFPLLGRISNSEQVHGSGFLGFSWVGPVFSAEFNCHGDTALAFRGELQHSDSINAWMGPWKGKIDTLKSVRDWRFQGVDEFRRPMAFWIFREGVAGFSGCYDPVLESEYLEKMQKTQVFWRKP